MTDHVSDAWDAEPLALQRAAERACTPKQLEALHLKVAGYGKKRIARILGISPQAVDARLDGATRAITKELE